MSLNIPQIKTAAVFDPAIKPVDPTDYIYSVNLGTSENAYRNVPASSYSSSNINYTFTMPNGAALKRIMYQVYEIILTFTSTVPINGGVGNMITENTDALRSLPIAKLTNSNALTINSQTITMPISDSIYGLQHLYLNDEEIRTHLTGTCTMLDNTQNYSSTYTTNLNPLGNMGINTYQPPRGGFQLAPVVGNKIDANASCQRIYRIIEPLLIPSMMFNTTSDSIYPVKDFQLTVQLVSNPGFAVWAHNNVDYPWGASGTYSINMAFNKAPTLLINTLSQNLAHPMADMNLYAMNNINMYYNNISTVPVYSNNVLATVSAPSQLLSTNAVPSKIVVFAQERRGSRSLTPFNSESFLSLQNLSIDFGNKTNILQGASQYDLYNLSRKYLGGMSFQSWSGMGRDSVKSQNYGFGCGSIFVCDVTELGLPADKVAGSSNSDNIQVTALFSNIDGVGAIRDYELVVCFVYDSVLTVTRDTAISNNVILSSSDVLNAVPVHDLDKDKADLKSKGIVGGFNLLKGIPMAIRQGVDLAKDVGKVVDVADSALKTFGYGLVRFPEQKGGKRLTRSKMQERLE